MVKDLPPEIWDRIYYFSHDLRGVHKELLTNCVRRRIQTRGNLYNEITYHKNINPLFKFDDFWKLHGYCNVKCGSLNWPHACNLCDVCNSDPEYCCCGVSHIIKDYIKKNNVFVYKSLVILIFINLFIMLKLTYLNNLYMFLCNVIL